MTSFTVKNNPKLLFVEIDQYRLCLTFAFKLSSLEEYVRFREKPLLKEQFHYAQIGLLSPIQPLIQSFIDSELEVLRVRSLAHLQASQPNSDLNAEALESRLLLLEASVSEPKNLANYLNHPLANSSF